MQLWLQSERAQSILRDSTADSEPTAPGLQPFSNFEGSKHLETHVAYPPRG